MENIGDISNGSDLSKSIIEDYNRIQVTSKNQHHQINDQFVSMEEPGDSENNKQQTTTIAETLSDNRKDNIGIKIQDTADKNSTINQQQQELIGNKLFRLQTNDDSPRENSLFYKEKSQIEYNLFQSLNSHIDFQYKLNQLNQTRILSFERFRKYCQRVASFSVGTTGERFDQEQFRNEYNRFDRNYRHWRKRIRKLRQETKSSLLSRCQNPYDTLYELFAKIENLERNKENLRDTKKPEDRYLPNDQIYPEISLNVMESSTSSINNRSIQDQSIQCNFNDSFVLCNKSKPRPRGRPPKNSATKSQYLPADVIYPEISLNVIEPSTSSTNSRKKIRANKDSDVMDDDFSLDDNETFSSDYSSDSSYGKAKSAKGRKLSSKKKTIKNKNFVKDKKLPKTTKPKSSTKKLTVIKQESCSNSNSSVAQDCPEVPVKKKRGRPKSLHPRVYQCENCQYSTTNSWNMNLHRRTHSDARPFQCDRCDMAFKIKAELRKHKNIHDGVRFHCSFEGCTANFSTQARVRCHIKIFHTKEAKLRYCDWEGCNYSTYESQSLKVHLEFHKDDRTHKCPYCDHAFKSAANLWKHRQKHENGDGFKCGINGCSYSSYSKELLKSHQATHFEERPFSCAWPGCGDTFKTSSALRSHKVTHENLRRYKCTWEGCDYAANLGSGLRCHVEAVHEKKKKKPRIRKKAKRNLNLDSTTNSMQFEKAQASSIDNPSNHSSMPASCLGPDIFNNASTTTPNNNDVNNTHSSILQLL